MQLPVSRFATNLPTAALSSTAWLSVCQTNPRYRGLQNLPKENLCCINVIVQLLRHCPQLRAGLAAYSITPLTTNGAGNSSTGGEIYGRYPCGFQDPCFPEAKRETTCQTCPSEEKTVPTSVITTQRARNHKRWWMHVAQPRFGNRERNTGRETRTNLQTYWPKFISRNHVEATVTRNLLVPVSPAP